MKKKNTFMKYTAVTESKLWITLVAVGSGVLVLSICVVYLVQVLNTT